MPVVYKQHFIIDADALIDYCNSDINVLSAFSQNIQLIHIGRSTFAKVNCLSEREATRHHLLIETPDLNTILKAGLKRGALSYDDHEALLLAKKNNWICITNDKALRKECEVDAINVLWGLEPMKILLKQRLITSTKAIKIAHLIRLNNPAYITRQILAKFEAEVENISK